eukprot:Sspe_Gene.104637::Locus_81333_Transcript_1_1_Confidence_1.000_Length_438::g.104637::m.104637
MSHSSPWAAFSWLRRDMVCRGVHFGMSLCPLPVRNHKEVCTTASLDIDTHCVDELVQGDLMSPIHSSHRPYAARISSGRKPGGRCWGPTCTPHPALRRRTRRNPPNYPNCPWLASSKRIFPVDQEQQ